MDRLEAVVHRTIEPKETRRGRIYKIPHGFRFDASVRFEAPDDDLIHVDVRVRTSPGPVRGLWHDFGRGTGAHRGGEVSLSVPPDWVWDRDTLAGSLAHELTHAADHDLHRREDRAGPGLTPDGLVPEAGAGDYANDPAEVAAVRHEIYREVTSRRSEEAIAYWMEHGFPWSPGRIPSVTEMTQTLITSTRAWARVGRYLTKDNVHKILRMAGPAVAETVAAIRARKVARGWLARIGASSMRGRAARGSPA